MFKRPPLRVANRLVNASLMLSLLFFTHACTRTDPSSDAAPPDAVQEAATTTPQTAPDGLVLPAVWQTAGLEAEITSIALADALGSTIAVAFTNGNLQLFNFEGERITDPAPLNVSKLSNGRYFLLQDTPITLFPAITQAGELVTYIHGGTLEAPLQYPLDTGIEETVSGLCSASPESETDGVMRIGFWTAEAPAELKSGRIVEVRDRLIVLLDEPVVADQAIAACVLTEQGAQVYSEPALAAVQYKRRYQTYQLTLDRSGGYMAISPTGQITPFNIRDGLSFKMPSRPVDMAGTGDARGGGYPNGLLIVGGETAEGDHTVTFIDPSVLLERR